MLVTGFFVYISSCSLPGRDQKLKDLVHLSLYFWQEFFIIQNVLVADKLILSTKLSWCYHSPEDTQPPYLAHIAHLPNTSKFKVPVSNANDLYSFLSIKVSYASIFRYNKANRLSLRCPQVFTLILLASLFTILILHMKSS